MSVPLAIIFTVLGLVIGSFLNVVIDRRPAGRSLFRPRSYCDSCGRTLAIRDLVPVFSYLWRRGRCRSCGARISLRVPLVEVLSGLLFFLAFWRFGLTPQFGVTVFWSGVFLVIMFIDFERQLILNEVTLPAAVVAIVILGLDSALPAAGILGNLGMMWEPSILSGVAGGATGLFFFLVVLIIAPRGMGMGDVKLAGLIGLAVGFPLVSVALLVGILAGGAVAVVLLLLRLKGRKDAVPYGTFLAIGPIVTLLWGREIFDWYLGFF